MSGYCKSYQVQILKNTDKNLIQIDCHCHSSYSPDSLSQIERLIQTAHKRGLGRIAITDHNSISGALKAQALDPDLVIVGEEILTTKGELLALFVTREVPRGLVPKAAIELLREQGAFISVSHPFDQHRNGWSLLELEKIAPYIDAIEVFNSRCSHKSMNLQAMKFAAEYGLAGTAGSDAHMYLEVGKATITMPAFSSVAEFKTQIKKASVSGKMSGEWVHLGSRWAWIFNQRRKEE